MAWSETCYPVSMSHLTPAVRARAIEVANDLLTKGWPDEAAARAGIDRAREWSLQTTLKHLAPRRRS